MPWIERDEDTSKSSTVLVVAASATTLKTASARGPNTRPATSASRRRG
jgi:hypothetical protein